MAALKVKKNDVILVSVYTGTLPAGKIPEYMKSIKKSIQKCFNNKIIMYMSRDPNGDSVKLSTIRKG